MSNARWWLAVGLMGTFTVPAMAQSFRVQCPTSTITHPGANNDAEPAYTRAYVSRRPEADYTSGKTGPVNGAIKCQQIAGGDGYATMGDGTQTYMFSFGPLSGLANIASGRPGTVSPTVFNTPYDPTKTAGPLLPGDPATTVGEASIPPGGLPGRRPDDDRELLQRCRRADVRYRQHRQHLRHRAGPDQLRHTPPGDRPDQLTSGPACKRSP